MSDSPADHGFDWLPARLQCCEAADSVRLRDPAERNSNEQRLASEVAARRCPCRG